MQRFYWLVEGVLAGCSRPGGSDRGGMREAAPEPHAVEDVSRAMESDLTWLRRQGVEAVLTLTETPLEAAVLERQGMEVLHLPVPDLTAPLPEQFKRALDFIDWQRSSGRAVAVHCLMGQGRTGAVLAAYLIRSGMGADEAVARLRAICPGAIGTPEQEWALKAFADRRDWIV
jgi:atypical dual specificity phosphatase